MIGYKLKNTTQFNLNCELVKKFLDKIDTVKFVKTNCSDILDIEVPFNSINLKVGQVEIGTCLVKFFIKETNYSDFAIGSFDIYDLLLRYTDETLQRMVKFLNENLSWEVR
jgi:hypothetical protein